MESLSFFELSDFSQWLQREMEGAQLQDLWTNGQVLVLQFYKYKDIFITVDTNSQSPLLIYLEREPDLQKKARPVVLFLNSHAKNLRWKNCWVLPEKGRVVFIELAGGERSCQIEIQLIPKAFNLMVESEGKRVSWEKPRELPASKVLAQNQPAAKDWKKWGEEWWTSQFASSSQIQKEVSKGSSDAADPRPRALEKKRKALSSIEAQLASDPAEKWKALGEALKISSEVPVGLAEKYVSEKSRSWNMDNAFSQAKHLLKKRSGTEKRMQLLREEIAALQEDLANNPHAVPAPVKPQLGAKLMEKSQSRGRRLQLEEGLEAVFGKSAADNLAILRKARAWDLWLHLKDYPGSHAIILRPKQKEIPPSVIQKVSEWLIKESLGHQKIQWGAKYEVVVVECRHVRPIKGDKLGRVTYHHPQVFSFASKA